MAHDQYCRVALLTELYVGRLGTRSRPGAFSAQPMLVDDEVWKAAVRTARAGGEG